MNKILILFFLTFFKLSFSYSILCSDLLGSYDELFKITTKDANLLRPQGVLDLTHDLNSLSSSDSQALATYMRRKDLKGINIGVWYNTGYRTLELSATKFSPDPVHPLLTDAHIIRDRRLFKAIELETRLNEIIEAEVSINPTQIQVRLDSDAVFDFFNTHKNQINLNLKDKNISHLTLGLELERAPVRVLISSTPQVGNSLRVEIRNQPTAFMNPAYLGQDLPLNVKRLEEQILRFNRRVHSPIPVVENKD